jgi:Transglutaminase-like superfamily
MATATAEGARHLPAGESLGPLARGRIVTEVVGAYLSARRELGGAPIETAVERLRDGAPGAGRTDAEAVEEARRLGWMVVRVLTFLPGDTRCLRRSLTLTRMLARREIESRLVIGARSAPSFLAHAWVECAGVPVLSTEGDSFVRLVEL